MSDYYLSYNSKSKNKAQHLRKKMTKEEKHLWYGFLCTYPVRIYRQRAIGNYIVDFYCSEALLIIEVDGSQHFTDDGLKTDTIRTEVLKKNNIEVIRFTNLDINLRFKDVCNTIDAAIQGRIKNK